METLNNGQLSSNILKKIGAYLCFKERETGMERNSRVKHAHSGLGSAGMGDSLGRGMPG